MRHIGIDPGKTGAVAFIADNGEVGYYDLNGIHFDTVLALRNAIGDEPCHVTLEKVHCRPMEGVSSVWTFAEGYGVLLGAVICHALPFSLVTPAKWKRDLLGAQSKDKDASRELARRLYPASGAWLKFKKDHGRAEALLLAHYGRMGEKG